jgi:hypothetical protein
MDVGRQPFPFIVSGADELFRYLVYRRGQRSGVLRGGLRA